MRNKKIGLIGLIRKFLGLLGLKKGYQGGIMKKEIKKGDKVRTPSGVGTVIVVDPSPCQPRCMSFLVEIEGWSLGQDARYWWDRWWYPEEYKTPSRSRWWFTKEELEKI